MKEEYITISEIWVPSDTGAGVTKDGKNYELVAMVANGHPVYLKEKVYLENILMTPEEYKRKFAHQTTIKE